MKGDAQNMAFKKCYFLYVLNKHDFKNSYGSGNK